jgi:AraC family transcriptional regulator
MRESIKLYRSGFGHVSILNVARDFVAHAHREAHIIVWLEGAAGAMTIGRETVQLGPRVATVINPFEPHSHVLSIDGTPGLFLAFYIDPDWIRCRRGLAERSPIFGKAFVSLYPSLRGAAVNILGALTETDGANDLTTYEIERFIDRVFDATRPEYRSVARPNRAQDFRVGKAIELMKAKVCERVCFDEVARSVGLSRPHFFALFKQQMNVTPNIYWNTLRMEEAVRQLESTEESLISVACHLGFTSQGNFSRFFRDHVGVPPTIYRSAARLAA